MENLEYEEVMGILDGYSIKYASLGVQGDVDFGLEEIRIDPRYRDDIGTLMHEFAHIYYEELLGLETPEDIIESESQRYLANNPSAYHCLGNYLENRTESINYR